MNEILALIKWVIDNGISVSVYLEPDIGSTDVIVKFRKGDKCINHAFYHVPCGDASFTSFKNYNPTYEIEIEKVLDELKNNENGIIS